MKRINPFLSTTFSEYILLPGLTKKEHTPDNISIRAPLIRYKPHEEEESSLCLNTPFTSASMQSVSDTELAIANAREGALSFIYCSQPIKSQVEMVASVKDYKAGFVESKVTLTKDHTLEDAIRLINKTNHSTIPITKEGRNDSELLGILTDQDYWMGYDKSDTPISSLMTPFDDLSYGRHGISLSEANEILRKSKKSCIAIIDKNKHLKYLVFKKDWINHVEYPLEMIDSEKRLMVGAAINTRDYKERVPALINAKADILVIDTSDGYNEYVKETLEWVKSNYDIPIGAGNVVTKKGFRYLARNGADFVKVGIGGGSICITQEVKGIGRGQVSALTEIAEERDKYLMDKQTYIPLCSDGGLIQDSHILIALALGADFVMMGRYYARCEESPPEKVLHEGRLVKPYWGEGSDRAKNWQRYHDMEGIQFEEGVDGYAPYAGNLSSVVKNSVNVIISTMSNLGCLNIKEMHENAVLERRSPASILEGKPHDIQITSDSFGTYKNIFWGK